MKKEYAILLAKHLIGDLILQNDWMASKNLSLVACRNNVLAYKIHVCKVSY
jgi:hypothetical protein